MMHRYAEMMTQWLLTRRSQVVAVTLLLLVASGAVMSRLEIEAGTGAFLAADAVEKRETDLVGERFGSDSYIFVGIKGSEVFSEPMLKMLRGMGEQALEITYQEPGGEIVHPVAEATSLATVKDLVGSDASFRTVPLVPDPIPTDPATLQGIRKRAEFNPLIADSLLFESPDTTLVMLRVGHDVSEQANAAAVEGVKRICDSYKKLLPQAEFHLVGEALLRRDAAIYMQADLSTFLPILYVVVVLVLYRLFRTVRAVLLALLCNTLCLMTGMATLKLIGGKIDNVSTMLPAVIMVLATATVIHFFSELAKNARAGNEADAAKQSLLELIPPVFICDVTTAVGFFSLMACPIPPIADFGLAAGIATLASFFAIFLVLGLAAATWKPSALVRPSALVLSDKFDGVVNRYVDKVVASPRIFLALSLLMVVVSLGFATRIVSDMSVATMFAERTTVRKAINYFREHLDGQGVIVASVRSTKPGAFLEPKNLERLDALAKFLRDELGATETTTIADHVKLMNRAFMAEDPAEYRIPASREQIAQLMLLNGDPSTLEYLDTPYQWARVMARSGVMSSAEYGRMFHRVDEFLDKTFPASEGFDFRRGVGGERIWSRVSDDMVRSQIQSFGLSFILIFGPIALLFRSWITALFSIPSNLFPIALVLGLMGASGIQLNIGTVMIASTILGIAVDDTVHFLMYLRERLRHHGDMALGLRETMHMKGAGAFWTALLLGSGFGVLAVSNFEPTQEFGVLSAAAILTGVVGEVMLLPPLLLITKTRLGLPALPSSAMPEAKVSAHSA